MTFIPRPCQAPIEINGGTTVVYCVKLLDKVDADGKPCHEGPCRPERPPCRPCRELLRYWESVDKGER